MANTVGITIKVNDADGQKLQRIQQQLDRLKASGSGSGGTFGSFSFPGLTEGTRGLQEAGQATEKFRQSIHALHPLLAGLGIEIGGLRNFSALAGAGFVALGAVIAGSLLIALEKLVDKAALAKKALSDLGIPSGQIEQISAGATKVGADLEQQASRIQKLQEAGAPKERFLKPTDYVRPYGTQPVTALPTDVENLEKVFATGAGSRTAGGAAFDKFLDQLQKSGGLTPDSVKDLPAGIAKSIADILGFKVQSGGPFSPQEQLAQFIAGRGANLAAQVDGTPEQQEQAFKAGSFVSRDELLLRTREHQPEINKQFDEFSKQPAPLDDALGDIGHAVEHLAESLGKAGVGDLIDGLAKSIDTLGASLKSNPLVQWAAGLNEKGEKPKAGEQATGPDTVRQSIVDYLKPQVKGSIADRVFTPVIQSLFGPEQKGIASPTITPSVVPGTKAYSDIEASQGSATPITGPSSPAPFVQGLVKRKPIGVASPSETSTGLPEVVGTQATGLPPTMQVIEPDEKASGGLVRGFADGGVVGPSGQTMTDAEYQKWLLHAFDGQPGGSNQKQSGPSAEERRAAEHQRARGQHWSALLAQHVGRANMFDPKAGGLGLQMFADKAGLIGGLRGIGSGFSSLFGPARHFSPMGGGQWTDGMAAGGMVAKFFGIGGDVFEGGPPNSTDTIPAWLTPGEHVQKKSAVDYYGRSFMDKLNNLQIPKSITMDGSAIKGFADGGWPGADGSTNGSTGDSASSSSGASPSSLTLNIGGKPHTLRTPDHQVLQQMTRAALEDSMLEIVPMQDSVR
jgi:hypothetical protein